MLIGGCDGKVIAVDRLGDVVWRKQDSGGYYRSCPSKMTISIDSMAYSNTSHAIVVVNTLGCVTLYSNLHMFSCRPAPTEQYFRTEFESTEHRFRNE